MDAASHKTTDQLLPHVATLSPCVMSNQAFQPVTKQAHLKLGEVGGVCV